MYKTTYIQIVKANKFNMLTNATLRNTKGLKLSVRKQSFFPLNGSENILENAEYLNFFQLENIFLSFKTDSFFFFSSISW